MQRLFLGKQGRQIVWVNSEAQKLGNRILDREWLYIIHILIYMHVEGGNYKKHRRFKS